MLSTSDYNSLKNGRSICNPDITSSKNKVLRLEFRGLKVRAKITKNHMIAIQDDNSDFVKALFPDHSDQWENRKSRSDSYVLEELIKYMRIRMELRRDIMDSAFANPAQTLRLLKLEHSTF